MIYLKQSDPKWGNVKLTPSNLTCARYGCTTTSICMLSDYFKCFTLPSVAIGHNIKYNKEGLIIWESINFPTFKFTERVRKFDQVKIDDHLKDPRKAVIFNVNNGGHWVTGVSKLPFGYYNCADPYTGKSRILKAKEIVGFATFIKK